MGNTIKFTEEGGVVSIAIHNGREDVSISVSDTGVSIAEQHHERIFERFQQVGRKEGGGRVSVWPSQRSWWNSTAGSSWCGVELGKGSIFTFTLPVYSLEALLREAVYTEFKLCHQSEYLSLIIFTFKQAEFEALQEEYSVSQRKQILEEVETIIRQVGRSLHDTVIRYGEGRIIIFLRDTPKSGAASV